MTSNLHRLSSVAFAKNAYFFDATPKELFSLPPGLVQEYLLMPPTVKVNSINSYHLLNYRMLISYGC